jgi:hypothetical protein
VYRQREFFDHRKEERRRNELGEESGKARTLADYIRQNLHGGESLDILGLRSLNPTPADVNSSANSDANPATGILFSLFISKFLCHVQNLLTLRP